LYAAAAARCRGEHPAVAIVEPGVLALNCNGAATPACSAAQSVSQ